MTMRISKNKIGLFFSIFGSLFTILIYFISFHFSYENIAVSGVLKKFQEPIITVSGTLHSKLFPGPPEYSCIENGDRKDYCWVLELDKPSFLLALNTPINELSLELSDILKRSDANQVIVILEKNMKNFSPEYENKNVIIQGHLFHAHTAHHYTPMLIQAKQILKLNYEFF